ncbi:MAG: hypothetical protein KF857_10840 [Fimbriimonadaceae bacterium]|nr:hypothetical protein [Fimbriimonadaceae bacterium]
MGPNEQTSKPSRWTDGRPFGLFLAWVAVLALLRLLVAAVPVPVDLVAPLSLLSTLVFVGGPIVALYVGGATAWRAGQASLVLAAGVALHVVGFAVARSAGGQGPAGVGGVVAMQSGVLVWCLGLGGLVSLVLKEKGLLLPVALFLAGFDVFLVMTPFAPTAKVVEQNPGVLKAVAMSVPQVNQAKPGEPPPAAKVVDLGLVGPADLAFMGMFFACLHRFGMRARRTVLWLAPVMALYFLLAISPFGIGMLPAMVPIGITVLAVNWREFGLQGQERVATWVVAAVSVALAGYGVYQRLTYKPPPEPPAEPSHAVPDPGPQAPAGSP